MHFTLVLTLLSSFSFIFYGLLCLFSPQMVEEFKRYKLIQFRQLTGALEILGGLGCLLGLYHQSLYQFSTLGLATLMFLGILVRIRIRDSLLQMLPAFVLCLLNIFLFLSTTGLLIL